MSLSSQSALELRPSLQAAIRALLPAWSADEIEPALTQLVASLLNSKIVPNQRLLELERADALARARISALRSDPLTPNGPLRRAVDIVRLAAVDESVSPQLDEAWSQLQRVAFPLICHAKLRHDTDTTEEVGEARFQSQMFALAAWYKGASDPMSLPHSRCLAGDVMWGGDRYPGVPGLGIPHRRDLVRCWLQEVVLAKESALFDAPYTPLTVHILLVEVELHRKLRHHRLGIDSGLSLTSGITISLLPLAVPVEQEAADEWLSDLARERPVDDRPDAVSGCMLVPLGPNGQSIWTAYQLDSSSGEATLYSWDQGYDIADRTREILRPLVERLFADRSDSSSWQYLCIRPRRLSPEEYRHAGQLSIQAVSVLLEDSIVPPRMSQELGQYRNEEDYVALRSRQIGRLLDHRDAAGQLYRDIQFGDRLLDRLVAPYDS